MHHRLSANIAPRQPLGMGKPARRIGIARQGDWALKLPRCVISTGSTRSRSVAIRRRLQASRFAELYRYLRCRAGGVMVPKRHLQNSEVLLEACTAVPLSPRRAVSAGVLTGRKARAS